MFYNESSDIQTHNTKTFPNGLVIKNSADAAAITGSYPSKLDGVITWWDVPLALANIAETIKQIVE